MGLFSIVARLTGDTSDFDRKVKGSMARTRSSVASAAAAVKGQLAAAFGVGAIIALERKTIQFGAKIKDMSDRLGIATDEVQKLTFAAEQGGASVDSMEKALRRLAKVRFDLLRGSTAEGADQLLASVGISLGELRGMSVDQLFTRIASSSLMSSGNVNRLGNAQVLFGRSGTELLPAIDAGLTNLARRLEEIGGVIAKGDIDNLKGAADAMDDLKRQMLAVGAEASPFLIAALQLARDVIVSSKDTASAVKKGASNLNFSSPRAFLASLAGSIETGVGSMAASRVSRLAGRAIGGSLNGFASGIGGGTPSSPTSPLPIAFQAAMMSGSLFNSTTAMKGANLNVGSLGAIGGFLGMGGQRDAVLTVERQQLAIQKDMKRVLENMERKGGGLEF